MLRSYYSNTIQKFLRNDDQKIYGALSQHHSHALEELQKGAWLGQIKILKEQLKDFNQGHIFFEFAIPRMGKRVDNVVIIGDTVFVIEFKVGTSFYEKYAIDQVIDYSLDLQNFHEGSHDLRLIPIVCATNAQPEESDLSKVENLEDVLKTNQSNLGEVMRKANIDHSSPIDAEAWADSRYKPTPTIIEAAQALYQNHNVEEISRNDAGAKNLASTSKRIDAIIDSVQKNKKKAICFVTGVPGAGKTLVGLNVANQRKDADKGEKAVFLSGNGPLVKVLREALTRDEIARSKALGNSVSRKDAERKTFPSIQNIHHFRDDNLDPTKVPIEKIVIFDEAQRAWTKEQASKFMQGKGHKDFDISEPTFLVGVMDRQPDWCTIIALIGGGQEINTGEAGLEEWITALKEHHADWEVHYSNKIVGDKNYLDQTELTSWLMQHGQAEEDLHLATSMRSFRSEELSLFVRSLLDLDKEKAGAVYQRISKNYPLVITRDLNKAKQWLKEKAKGTERYGIIGSSGARRLRPFGIDVKNTIDPAQWFLNDDEDVRSSYFMEDIATEFDIQGLEIDWACVAWGGNLNIHKDAWRYIKFRGTKWQNINKEIDQNYLLNTYRVLLTRARQGMVIYLPEGDELDPTRPAEYYDGTYNYFNEIGIEEL